MDKKNFEAVSPLSPAQHDALPDGERSSASDCGQLRCQLHGDLDVAAFEQAWKSVVARHATLRTVLVRKGLKAPVQVVYRHAEASVPIVFATLTASRDAALAAFLREQVEQLLGTFEQLLVRPLLCRFPDGSHELVISYHRAALDEAGVALVARDLFAAYALFARGQKPTSDPAPAYREYVLWARARELASPDAPVLATPDPGPGTLVALGESAPGPHALIGRPVPADVLGFAKSRALSLETLVHAALAVVVSRYTGRREVAFGATLRGRPRELSGAEAMAGCFTRTLPVCVSVDPDALVDGWLGAVGSAREAVGHRAHASAAGPAGERASTLVEGEPAPLPSGEFAGLRVVRAEARGPVRAAFALTVCGGPAPALVVDHDPARFPASRVARILSHVELVLGAMVSAGDRSVGTLLSLLSPESQYLLEEWNQTAAPHSVAPAHGLFQAQALRSPDALAITGDGLELSYADVARRASGLASRLCQLGVLPETPVAIFFDGAAGAIVAQLAVLEAGGTCVALDPAWPFERACFVLEDAQPAMILTEARLADELPPSWAQVILVDDVVEQAAAPTARPAVEVAPTGVACIAYGPGATDAAGVILTHDAVTVAVERRGLAFGLAPGDRVALVGSPAAAAASGTMLACLVSGASVVVDACPRTSVPDFAAWCSARAITVLALPAAFFEQLALELDRGDLALGTPLRLVTVVGPVRADRVAAWRRSGRPMLVLTYGPVEASSLALLSRPGASSTEAEGCIGQPAPNARAYLLDDALAPVSVGALGELYLGGLGLARGYRNRAELDAARFVPDPFGGPGERLFRTGERGRYLGDGTISIVGQAGDGAALGETRTGYTAPRTAREELLASLWADVLGLPEVGIDANFFELGGDSMRCIQVLGRAQQLGLGYSLEQLFEHQTIRELASAACAERPASAPAVPARAAFRLIGDEDRAKIGPGIEDAYPLTALQKGMLFHSELDPESGVYHEVTTSHLGLRFDEPLFRAALGALVGRHPVLRTCFDLTTFSEPLQLVAASAEIPVEVEDLRHLSPAEQERVVETAFEDQRRRRIDWSRPPLLRYQIHVRGADTFQLTMTELHMILDGWSAAHLLTELFSHYKALLEGRSHAKEAVPESTFSDFVALERAAVTSPEHRQYWQGRLEGVAASALPRLPRRAQAPATRPGILDVAVSDEVALGLKQLATVARVPLKSVYLAAHLRVLAAIENRTDVLTGLVSNGRPDAGGERLLGLFLNTLPFRQQLTGGTWVELVQATFESEQASLPHRRYPLAELQRLFGQGAALFETEFNFTHFHVYQELAKDTAVLGDQAFERNNFTLVTDVNLDAVSSRPRMHLNYDADALSEEQVRAIASYYARTLSEMAAAPTARYDAFSPVPQAEWTRQVVEWNATEVVYPRAASLHALIEAQVRATPEARAVLFDDAAGLHPALTYRELDARANRLARHLIASGVAPGSLVAVCADRSLEMIVALLAVLKAGGAYVPLDPGYPAARLALMLSDSGAPIVLTQAHLEPLVSCSSARVLCLDASPAPWERESADDPAVAVAPEDLAYVIYTSGSTGRPKGVMNTHAGICNRLQWMQATYRLTSEDVVLQKTSFSFDVSVWELFWPLLSGACLVMARPDGHKDSAYLADVIARERVTTIHFVPPMLQMFLEEPSLAGCGSLRRVICSGEALPFDLTQRCFARLDAELHNLYGPTEAAIDVTYWPCERGSTLGIVPIGRPIANTQMFVLDAALRPVPIGTPGELHIGGVGLARGYLNRPELTRERFIQSPLSADPGARLYKTGDLARYLPDGAIEYLGRLDNQVKIRGFRIELGEIEAVLGRHDDVGAVVVLARALAGGEKQLVAYVTPAEPGGGVDGQALRRHAATTLPEYMVPAAFVVLEAIPLTPNGKVDRQALPAPSDARPQLEQAYVAPRTPAEEALARIWATVLQIEQVGVHDNFFSLGGDSIRSLSVAARARAQGLSFSLQDLFRWPTIAALVAERSPAPALSATPASRPFGLLEAADRARLPAGIADAYPMTALQTGLVFHSELRPGTAIYHDINTVKVRGRMVPDLFRAAVQHVVDRHPILRTAFRLVGFGQPLQLVYERVAARITFEDLRDLEPEAQTRAFEAFVEREKRWHFDWAEPALVRFFVHILDDSTFWYSLSFHDSTLDGWSASAMDTELFRTYHELLAGKTPSAGEPPVPYREFVALELEALASPDARRYWLDRLEGGVRTEIPRWTEPASAADGVAIRFHEVAVPKEVSDALKRTAKALAIPIKSVLLAAHMKVLGTLSGSNDVATGLEHNGRPESIGAEQTLGLFLNTVPFRMGLGHGTWTELIRAAYEAEIELLPFRRYPMSALQQELARGDLFEAVFNYTHFHVSREASALTGFEVIESGGVLETQYPLRAEFDRNVLTDDLALSLHFDVHELTEAQVTAIGACYLSALRLIAADPSSSHEAESLLPPEERARILNTWNDTRVETSLERPFPVLFAEEAAKAPSAIAIECDGEALRYDELNLRANRLAHALTDRGVGPEVLVAVGMERGIDLAVAVLGILKAGGAYLPLDPHHPSERLAGVIARSGCRLVLAGDDLLPALSGAIEIGRGLAAEAAPPALCSLAELLAAPASDANPAPRARPENLAYVIYTSGSTGQPKGAMIEHRGMLNHLFAKISDLALGADDVVAQTASQCFDISVWQLLAPLLVGGRVVVCRDEIAHDASRLLAHVETRGVTVLETVPSFLRALLDEVAAHGPAHVPLSRLRWMIPTGEELPAELCRRWLRQYPAIPLVNAYGPTECSDDVTHFAMRVPPDEIERRVSVGRPIANTRIYVLDSALVPVPLGCTGELCVGGVGVGRGYLGNQVQTAEVFVPDPFSAEPGARLYRTGDLARYRPDGNVEFVGRVDHQVKLRGFRIELGEIDAALRAHAGVASAVVTVRADVPGQDRLVAYVVPSGQAPSAQTLRAFLGERLPDYMVPAAYVMLSALPLTSNGKIDRRALPAPDASSIGRVRELMPPRDDVELELVKIWQDVLGLDAVGVNDDFFEIGGHSLLAVRLMARIEERFGKKLRLAALVDGPTIEVMAAHLRGTQGTDHRSPLVTVQRGGDAPAIFAVHPVGGNVVCYLQLARRLGKDRPFHALQSPGLEPGQQPLTTVEAMAAVYLEAIRRVQPQGPYSLLGWSMGGVVAFEIARRLRAIGEPVALLAMIDSYPPEAFEAEADGPAAAHLLARDLGRTFGREIEVPASTLEGRTAAEQLDAVIEQARAQGVLPRDLDAEHMRRLAQMFVNNRRASARYRPGAFDGSIVHFAATESLADGGPDTGWERLAAGGVKVHPIPGDHYSILQHDDLASGLGTLLRSVLPAALPARLASQ